MKTRALEGKCRAWDTHASVKKPPPALQEFPDDPERPDFLESLLPFGTHPTYQALSDVQRKAILASAWLAYNERVSTVETEIVSPAATDLLTGRLHGEEDPVSREALIQTVVDEAYHVLLMQRANAVTRERRGLVGLQLRGFAIAARMHGAIDHYPESWQHRIIQLLCATAIETSISDYLSELSSSDVVQPLNRAVTRIHLLDELTHAEVYRRHAEHVYRLLPASRREFFIQMLPAPWLWLRDPDLHVWAEIFEQLRLPSMRGMLADCAERYAREDIRDDIISQAVNFGHQLGVPEARVIAEALDHWTATRSTVGSRSHPWY